jgi:endo-1,4-beta-xylanase
MKAQLIKRPNPFCNLQLLLFIPCLLLFSSLPEKVYGQDEADVPVIVEADSGEVGSSFSTQQEGDITYIATTDNYTGQAGPGDTSRMVTFDVEFREAGIYNLFVRVRVGSGGFDDDSFFYGNGFGEKEENNEADWILNNGLAAAGFSFPIDYVDGPGEAGSEVWKWVNLSKNAYQESGLPFIVEEGNLTQIFQIGSREDGLDIDKIAFGKADLFFTVNALDNELPGSTTMEDNRMIYEGPPLSEGLPKYLGCGYSSVVDNNFANYWTQLTPGNAGKWGSVGGAPDTAQWDWSTLDFAYNYAKQNDLVFKNHTLIWGEQQPAWISGLNPSEQLEYIETWIKMVGERYPDMDQVDVVNEPLPNHNPPDGIAGSTNYKAALGGDGETGWDWVIKSFELARKYMPNTELLLNDYGIINSNSNTNAYLEIINLLKERDLIDGIGVQGHRFELENAPVTTLTNNLDKLAATGLPIYISEMDLGNLGNVGEPDDEEQLALYQRIFPVLWEHPGVKGITLWGYLEGRVWQETCFLVRYDGSWRPAMEWLAQYLENSVVTSTKENALKVNGLINQNYPNPFQSRTQIEYHIPYRTRVTLNILDAQGKVVKTLVNETQPEGSYTLTFNRDELPGGLYFYSLEAGGYSEIKRMLISP